MTGERPLGAPWQVKFAILAAVWGSSFLLMKVGLEALAPIQISALRIGTGALTLLVTALALRVPWPRRRRTWAHLCVAAVVLCSVPFTLFPLGEERISSALAGIGNATTPLSAVLFTLVLVPAERADRRTLAAVLSGFFGVVVILQPWQAQGRPDLLGFGMTLLAGASYGLGWTYVRRFVPSDDGGGLGLVAAQLLLAAAQMLLVSLAWSLLRHEQSFDGVRAPWTLSDGARPLWPVAAVLVLGVIGTGLAYALQWDVVQQVGATIGSTVTFVIPVVAVVLGIVFLHERLQWPQVVGAAIVLGSAVLIGRPRRSPAVTPAAPTPSSTGRS